MKEGPILKRVLLTCSRGTTRLFRTSVALAWVGKAIVFKSTQLVTVHHGDVLIRQGRRLRIGHPGWSDLTGWTQVLIKPEHIDKTLAVFTVIEVKAPLGKLTEDQTKFGNMVTKAGGIFGMARSPEDAERILKVLTP